MREFELERILCPVDLSEASVRPLAYAGAIAGWHGAHVTALYAAPALAPTAAPGGPASDSSAVIPDCSREKVMHRLWETVSSAGIDERNAIVVVEESEPATAIVEQATTMQADLIVMGTHEGNPFDALLLGAATERVLREAPCPVLNVPLHAPSSPPPLGQPFKPILCAIDFSPSSVKSFRYAVEMGRRAGTRVVVVHAIEWPTEDDTVAELREYLIDDARRQLAAIVSHQTVGSCDVRTIVAVGRAHREILRIADEEDAGLIVMGAQGRSGAALALFGSTTQQVLRLASRAVLTAR